MITETIKWGRKTFTVPEGFVAALVSTFKVGESAYIAGTNKGRPWAYGPFTVHNPERHLLKNNKNRVFPDQSSHWLRRQP